MPSGLADREGVQGDQITRPSREVAEPEGAVLGRGGEDAGGHGGELGQGGHPLGPAAEPMPTQELLHAGGRQPHPTLGQVLDQPPSPDGWGGHRLGQHRLDLVGGVAVGSTGGRRSLGSSAASPERWARPAQR